MNKLVFFDKQRTNTIELLIIYCSLSAWAVILGFMGAVANWLWLGLVLGSLLWLATVQLNRRETRIAYIVDSYVKCYRASPTAQREQSALQMLLEAGAVTTRNNWELKAVRKRIREQNIPDCADLFPILKRVNLHRFLRFALENNLSLQSEAAISAAIERYYALPDLPTS